MLEKLTSVQAREVISRPFDRIEVVALETGPDKQQLQWAASLDYEVAFYEFDKEWYCFRGTERGIPMFGIPLRSTNFIHSHPTFPGESPETVSMPSVLDFHNTAVGVSAVIASSVGITQYFPPERYEGRRALQREIEAFRQRFNKPSALEEYKRFLEENELKFTVTLWDNVTDESLSALLNARFV